MRVQSCEERARVASKPTGPVPFGPEFLGDVGSYYPGRSLRHDSLPGRCRKILQVLATMAGARVVFLYRLGHLLHHRGGAPGRLAASALAWWSRHWYGCAISPEARLYGGMNLPHPQGIVIGRGVVVARGAWIFQNVTIGPAPGRVGMPTLGVHARILTGAVLIGPVTVGDHVQVSANVLVDADVPDRSRVLPPRPEVSPLPG